MSTPIIRWVNEVAPIRNEDRALLPAQPLPMPVWADTADVLLGSWPEVEIAFTRTITVPELDARVTLGSVDTIFAADRDYQNGDVWKLGDVARDENPAVTITVGHRSVDFNYTGTLDLRILGAAILDFASALDRAPAEIRRATDPGGPDQNGIGGGL